MKAFVGNKPNVHSRNIFVQRVVTSTVKLVQLDLTDSSFNFEKSSFINLSNRLNTRSNISYVKNGNIGMSVWYRLRKWATLLAMDRKMLAFTSNNASPQLAATTLKDLFGGLPNCSTCGHISKALSTTVTLSFYPPMWAKLFWGERWSSDCHKVVTAEQVSP